MLMGKMKKLLLIGLIAMLFSSAIIAEGQQEPMEEPQDLLFTEGANVWQASLSSPVGETIPEGFRVTVIGSGLPNLNLDKIGPSILVEYKEQKFLVDCGFEAVTGLMKVGVKAGQINNMFFTHQHVDHNADFTTFFIGGWEEERYQLTLAGPSVQKLYDVITDFYQEDINYRIHIDSKPDGMLTNVDIHDFTEDTETFNVGEVKISAIPVPHTLRTYAYKFEAGGQKVVVTGDMSYNEQIKKFSEGADILVIDALQAANFDDVPADFRETLKKNLSRAHIMNEDIGNVASAAAPANLVLVHWSGGLTLQNSIDLYREAGYEGHVIKGIDGLVIEP